MKSIPNCFIKYIPISFFVSFILWGCEPEPNALKPNIVLILADDLGYGGLGCYGNTKINTPNIDDLARNGIRFTDFHSNGSVCSPTRAALLTGNYQQRSGLEGVVYARGKTRQVGLDTSQVTIAKLLKKNGYTTGIMGKWHLGYTKEFNPIHHGFDEFFGYVSGNVDYHSHYDGTGIYDWWNNLDIFEEEGYVTDLITEHAVDFIESNKDNPFFLYVPHEAPHVPFQGRKDPAYRFADNEFTYYGPVSDTLTTYNEMVEVMDEGVGKIMEALKRNGLAENTLIFFISDNGAEKFGDNGGLNGNKISLLEGGHRVPGIAYWKNRIKPGIIDETLMTMDMLPTILALTNTSTKEQIQFDGVDFSKVLFENSALENRTLFWRYTNEKVIRESQWKLFITGNDTALFNLKENLAETLDMSPHKKNIVNDLLIKLAAWENDIDENVIMKTR
jgi:arylsulfatase A